MNIRFFLNAVLIVLTVLYPVGIYFGLQYLQPRYLILALVALLALRFITNAPAAKQQRQQQFVFFAVIMLFASFVFINNRQESLLFYPVVVNAVMLVLFSSTLLFPPSMIERLARLGTPDLPDAAIAYTRKVTMVWCVFFILNGTIASLTAVFADMATWTLYNGFISYVLMGCLFLVEYVVRLQIKKRQS